MGRYERTGRKIKEESVLLEKFIKEEIKKEMVRKYKVLNALCDEYRWSRSDYERIMKWLNGYNKRVEIGLVIDALITLGIDWKEIIQKALRKRELY